MAPAALPNLQRALNQEAGLRVSTDLRDLAITDNKLFDYHLVFMHGRHEFRLSDAERKQLRLFLERGGMILADAVCASPAFDRAFRREIVRDLPRDLRCSASPRIIRCSRRNTAASTCAPSRAATRSAAKGGRRPACGKVEPELEGLKLGTRYAVIYSPYDLSCALESHESLECKGYIREDAARIGINVVLYSLHE